MLPPLPCCGFQRAAGTWPRSGAVKVQLSTTRGSFAPLLSEAISPRLPQMKALGRVLGLADVVGPHDEPADDLRVPDGGQVGQPGTGRASDEDGAAQT